MLSNMMFFLEENMEAAASLSESDQMPLFLRILITFGPLVCLICSALLFFLILYFFLMRSLKKQNNEVQKIRGRISVGDKVTTISGITGEVIQIKGDDIYIVETGTDKSH